MTTNLLSVIEQLVGALEEWERVDVLGREPHIHRESCKQFVQDRNIKHTAALAAGKQALEQAQGEIFGYVSEHNCEGPFRWQFHKDSKQIYYDNCKFVTAVYTHPQATEPAPIGFNGLTQAETEATMSVRGLSEPAPSTAGEREELAKQLLYYSGEGIQLKPAREAQRRAAALLSAPALPVPSDSDDLIKALADVRDLFPIPERGSKLEHAWMEAVAFPESVPAYVRACIAHAAMPVGELTPLDTPEPDKYVDCGEARPLPMFHLSTLLQYGARIAAASTQPVREPTDGPIISGYAIPVSERRFASEILIQRSRQIEGPPLWAVRLDGNCLNKSGEWEWEPMPSSRDDEFLARCRFDSAESAIAAAHGITKKGAPGAAKEQTP